MTGIPELQETVTIGKIALGGPQHPEHREKTETHHQSSCEKGLFTYTGASA